MSSKTYDNTELNKSSSYCEALKQKTSSKLRDCGSVRRTDAELPRWMCKLMRYFKNSKNLGFPVLAMISFPSVPRNLSAAGPIAPKVSKPIGMKWYVPVMRWYFSTLNSSALLAASRCFAASGDVAIRNGVDTRYVPNHPLSVRPGHMGLAVGTQPIAQAPPFQTTRVTSQIQRSLRGDNIKGLERSRN